MNTLTTKFFSLLFIVTVVFSSCTKDEDPIEQEVPPTDLSTNFEWHDDSLTTSEVKWYKIKCDPGTFMTYVEWAELDAHGESKNYTANIIVSAYQLDGATPYFEDKDNGFGTQLKQFELANSESSFLLKVVVNNATPGTYSIRSKSVSTVEAVYTDLEIGDTWRDTTISGNQIVGFKVKVGDAKKLQIIWAEFDSPEADQGYTADIVGSVFMQDGTTPYNDTEKGKPFLDKNKSHTNDPKMIMVEPLEKHIKIQLKKGTLNGKFAIKVTKIE